MGQGYTFAVDSMKIKQLFTSPSLSDDVSVVGLLHAKVPVATMMVHQWQYCTIQVPLVPLHELIHQWRMKKSSARLNPTLTVPYSHCKNLMESADFQ